MKWALETWEWNYHCSTYLIVQVLQFATYWHVMKSYKLVNNESLHMIYFVFLFYFFFVFIDLLFKVRFSMGKGSCFPWWESFFFYHYIKEVHTFYDGLSAPYISHSLLHCGSHLSHILFSNSCRMMMVVLDNG